MATDWLDVHNPAPLPLLYARALWRREVRADAWPRQGLRCPVEVDPAHLQRYRQLCGFADDALLPPTYPHLLAFALQLQLLTAADFPVPLLGLVHLGNRIRGVRALGGLGPFSLSVQVEALRAHDKGAVFSLVTRLEDQLGLLWEADSQFLSRALHPPVDTALADPDEPAADAQTLSLLAQWPAPAGIGRTYARLSGDCNPIHLSAPSARLFGFPRAIAHGLWAKARVLAALGERLPAAGYRVQVRFHKPVLLPSELRLLSREAEDGGQFSLLGPTQTPHLHGSWQRT